MGKSSRMYVANEDMVIEFANNTGQTYTGDIGIADPAVTATVSTKCKAVGKGICTKDLAIAFVVGGKDCPHTFAGHTFVAGVVNIVATSASTKAENLIVLREGDANTLLSAPPGTGCIGSWTNDSSGVTVPCQCNVEISDAGQDKVKAQ